MNNYITVQEAARRSGLSEDTIRDLCRRNILSHNRPHETGQFLIDPRSFDEYLQHQNRSPEATPSTCSKLFNRGWALVVVISVLVTILSFVLTFIFRYMSICDAVLVPYLCSSKPTSSVMATTTPTTFTGYDFESSIQGWDTSEGSFKLAKLESTTERAYSGQHSLKVTSELYGDASEEFTSKGKKGAFRDTETKIYFDNVPPQGMGASGPYNLREKTVSCYVYFPSGLILENNPQTYVRLFVKDLLQHNQYSDPVNISVSNIEQWILLSFVVGVGNGMDPDFDPTQINALGVRVDLPEHSKLVYTGAFYVDECSIKYP